MNDYKFDFLARTLLAILDVMTTLVSRTDPDRTSFSTLYELQEQHENWKKSRG